MKNKKLSNYISILLLLVALWLVFLIVQPFLISMMTSVLIAYITYPLFVYINKWIKNRNVSAIIMAILIIILITLPFFFVLNIISREAYVGYITSKQKLFSGDFLAFECTDETTIVCKIAGPIKGLLEEPKVRYYLEDTLNKTTSFIIDNVSNLLFSIPMIIINFFVMVFVLFYLFKDGRKFFEKVERLLPLKKHHTKHVLKRINEVTYAVVYGQLLVAMAQGALGGLGFLIFGIPSPFLWGIIMALLALVPWLGPPIIWLPAALFQIIEGYSQSDNSLITKGVLLILYGMLVVGTIDNLLRPKLIGERGGIHPILALIGVIGGLRIFGFIGIFAGPIILAVFTALLRIYGEDKSLLQIDKKKG